jgi:FkbM family methyltransferase
MQTNGELHALRRCIFGVDKPIVFDVGANIGDWSAAVLKILPTTQIHCFEPDSSALKQLEHRGFPSNVHVNRFGLSSELGVQKLTIFKPGSVLNSLYTNHLYGLDVVGYEEVRLDTIDNYCIKNKISRINYLKIDVEGHELAVLKGACKLIEASKIHNIQFEYYQTYLSAGLFLRSIFEFFSVYKCNIYKIHPNGLLPIDKYSADLENFYYSNYLAMFDCGGGR